MVSTEPPPSLLVVARRRNHSVWWRRRSAAIPLALSILLASVTLGDDLGTHQGVNANFDPWNEPKLKKLPAVEFNHDWANSNNVRMRCRFSGPKARGTGRLLRHSANCVTEARRSATKASAACDQRRKSALIQDYGGRQCGPCISDSEFATYY